MSYPIAPHPIRHFTDRRPWAPMTDAEWAALAPLVAVPDATPGPKPDLRHRMDAILLIATRDDPWRKLPEQFGKPDTVSRHFLRLSEAGVWQRVLEALAAEDCPAPLRAMEYWLCRAFRRARNTLQMEAIDLPQKLGFLTALPMVPWVLPNRHYSELAWTWTRSLIDDMMKGLEPAPGEIKKLMILHRLAAGRRYSSVFAPP